MMHRTIPFIMAVAIMTIATVSVGGPLDRLPDARTNPAVDDMLRIPGVIGQTKSEACAILQQAGINPVVHIIGSETAKHKGKECQVVKQSPLPGGVAMIGSSVEIEVYAPNDCVDQTGSDAYEEEVPGDGTQWSEDEENNWTPEGGVEDPSESDAQGHGLTKQTGAGLPQVEKPPLQKLQQKKIHWKPMRKPLPQKPSTPIPQSKRLDDQNPTTKSTLTGVKPIKKEEDK
jgi:beta-lactam-binding protein with PASTA domain